MQRKPFPIGMRFFSNGRSICCLIIASSLLPSGCPPAHNSTLQLTKERFLVEWEMTIAADIMAGKRVLIAAHGNTIRGLCQHLDDISDDEITGLDIPTGELCNVGRKKKKRPAEAWEYEETLLRSGWLVTGLSSHSLVSGQAGIQTHGSAILDYETADFHRA